MSDPLLSRTAALAQEFLASLRERPVGATATRELQAGVYELVLSVQDAATGESLKRRERFEIVS